MIVNICERQLQGVTFAPNGQAYIGWMPSGEYTFMYKCDLDIHTATERKGVKLSYTYKGGYIEHWFITVPAWGLLIAEQMSPKMNKHTELHEGITGGGEPVYMIVTVHNTTGEWMHTERFTTEQEAMNWVGCSTVPHHS